MNRTRKNEWWIVWADGSESRVTKVSGGWRWIPLEGGEAVSSHLDNLKYQVELDGGRVERRLNPHYDPQYMVEMKRQRDRQGPPELGRLLGELFR